MAWRRPYYRTVVGTLCSVCLLPSRLARFTLKRLLEPCGLTLTTAPVHRRSFLTNFVSIVEGFRVLAPMAPAAGSRTRVLPRLVTLSKHSPQRRPRYPPARWSVSARFASTIMARQTSSQPSRVASPVLSVVLRT